VPFGQLPATAAWRHRDARNGFESVFFGSRGHGHRIEGHTAAVEAGEAWAVRYTIDVDDDWVTRRATAIGRSSAGEGRVELEAREPGRWLVDGVEAPELEGCFDVDLESSACTNTLPVHRLHLAIGDRSEAPAVYIRAIDLSVERLEQIYTRLEGAAETRFHYESPRFDYDDLLDYDASGLIVEYPGIATRIL
jgi:hypothetical protein